MKRQLKKMIGGLLVAGIVAAGISAGATANAANSGLGATGALSDSEYTVKEMLVYAIEDEYLAQAEYDAIMDKFGVQRPFSNIIKEEATHISFLTPLLKEYSVTLPAKDWASMVTVPESLEAAYETGVTAEKNNIAMYESFLKKDLPEDVKDAFTALANASENHLAAFERWEDGACTVEGTGSCYGSGTGSCYGTGTGGRMGRGNGSCGGLGQGNRSSLHGSCVIE